MFVNILQKLGLVLVLIAFSLFAQNAYSANESVDSMIKRIHQYEYELEVKKQNLGDARPDIVSTLDNMAKVYYQQQEYNKALVVLERAFAIYDAAMRKVPSTIGSDR